jgi:hypothetical protein
MSDLHGAASPGADGQSRNPTVAFERSDVYTRGILVFALALAAGIAAAMLVVLALFWRFHDDRSQKTNSDLPVVQDARRQFAATGPDGLLPPPPRLEGIAPITSDRLIGRLPPGENQPSSDIGRIVPGTAQRYYASQEILLRETWEWTDKNHTAARLPVDVAMSRLLAKPGAGLKARNEDRTADEPAAQPSRSNSGRTSEGAKP